MKNNSMKNSALNEVAAPAFAVPLSQDSRSSSAIANTSETEKRMLLFRLSDAGARIREESDLIRRVVFSDNSSRLLRILGETVEEQRLALATTLGGESK